MKKTLAFGNIDCENTGQLNCLITVELELKDTSSGPVFTASGNIWNPRKTDIYSGGQNLDELVKLIPHDKKLQRIHALWQRWHLNDLHAGCEHQRALKRIHQQLDYVLGQKCSVCGYAYGSQWLYEPIPEDVLQEIKNLIQEK